MKGRILRASALIMLTVLLCIASNFAAFFIDSPQMREHVWQGALLLGEQQGQPQMIGGFPSAQLDNFTSVLILKTAGYVGNETLLQKAVGGYRVDMAPEDGQSEWDAFCNYEFGWNSPTGGLSYSRYWHGYTLPLRLLLCVFNLSNLQMLLYFAQLTLFIYVLYLMGKRGLSRLVPGFFLSYFLLMPMATSVCLQYVPVTMLMLLGCTAILLWDKPIDKAIGLPTFFALLGLLTNYYDLLTFPLVSLGFPLAMLLCLRMKAQDGFLRLFMLTAFCGVSWALGYACMWALKWVLAACCYGWWMFGGIASQIFLRASDDGGSLSRIGVLVRNMNVIFSKASYLLLGGIAGLVTLFPAAKGLKKRAVRFDARALMLLIVAVVPLMWYIVMANHSYDHTYFTYRNLAVSAMAGYAFLAFFLRGKSGDAP